MSNRCILICIGTCKQQETLVMMNTECDVKCYVMKESSILNMYNID